MKFIKNAVIMAVAVMVPLSIVDLSYAGSQATSGHSVHWGYEGAGGPAHWGDLGKKFALCKAGKGQSPVDITGAVKADLAPIKTSYKDVPLRVINNGHTIKVNYVEGSTAVIGGKTYSLLQFHFHGPSENIVDGKAFPLEAHLVHKSEDGDLAVIGVFLKEGKKNDLIQAIWNNIPDKVGPERTAKGIKINASSLLPSNQEYYNFTGSLTTPPCSEGVSWNVMTTPIEVSAEQIAKFAFYYKMNARPVQPLNNRVIKVSK